VCKAHRIVYHSSLGLRVIRKKKKNQDSQGQGIASAVSILQVREVKLVQVVPSSLVSAAPTSDQ